MPSGDGSFVLHCAPYIYKIGHRFLFLIFLYFLAPSSLSTVSECVAVVPIAEKQVTSAQLKEHRGAVLDLIETYLRGEFIQLITIQTAYVIYPVLFGPFYIQLIIFRPLTGSGSSLGALQAGCSGFNMAFCTNNILANRM